MEAEERMKITIIYREQFFRREIAEPFVGRTQVCKEVEHCPAFSADAAVQRGEGKNTPKRIPRLQAGK